MTVNRYRLSLRALIAGVSLVCVLAAALASPRSPWTSILLWLLIFALPGCLALGICYCRGPTRAFFIGAILPAATPLLNFASSTWATGMAIGGEPKGLLDMLHYISREQACDQRSVVTTIWLLSLFAGGLAAAVARILECRTERGTQRLDETSGQRHDGGA